MTRVRITLSTLITIAILATGALSLALIADPSPAAGLAVALSATVLLASALLTLRILMVVDRGR